ncbi:GntR family transcriptional regulator [Marinactinospora rubrisoli]|uniref:GntR family transcriptional regulator n=1 Tax=Marinactinospora rubrisoli TaxID=2715399 RepID=A0ABW2KFT0_9ACTN
MTLPTTGPLDGPLPRRTSRGLSGQVYDRLYQAIVTVRYPPGGRLSEKDLAAELGVSRTPVRDAVYRLAEEGLVEVFPQHGTFVARIDQQAFADAQFVRESLERSALRLATERATSEHIARMRANLAEQEDAMRRADAERFVELDQRLHQLLFDAAGHSGAGAVARRARPHMDRVRRLTLPDATGYEGLVADHRAIVDAVESRDAAAGDAVLTPHLRLILETVKFVRERHPEYFGTDDADGTGRVAG